MMNRKAISMLKDFEDKFSYCYTNFCANSIKSDDKDGNHNMRRYIYSVSTLLNDIYKELDRDYKTR